VIARKLGLSPGRLFAWRRILGTRPSSIASTSPQSPARAATSASSLPRCATVWCRGPLAVRRCGGTDGLDERPVIVGLSAHGFAVASQEHGGSLAEGHGSAERGLLHYRARRTRRARPAPVRSTTSARVAGRIGPILSNNCPWLTNSG
jgi:hypothetical protein